MLEYRVAGVGLQFVGRPQKQQRSQRRTSVFLIASIMGSLGNRCDRCVPSLCLSLRRQGLQLMGGQDSLLCAIGKPCHQQGRSKPQRADQGTTSSHARVKWFLATPPGNRTTSSRATGACLNSGMSPLPKRTRRAVNTPTIGLAKWDMKRLPVTSLVRRLTGP